MSYQLRGEWYNPVAYEQARQQRHDKILWIIILIGLFLFLGFMGLILCFFGLILKQGCTWIGPKFKQFTLMNEKDEW